MRQPLRFEAFPRLMIPRSILVYISSHVDNALGENIIKLPFLRALKAAWPAARLTWVPGLGPAHYAGGLAPLVDGLIDELVTDLDLPDDQRGFFRLGNPMPGRSFDLIIDTQRKLARTLQLRRIPHRCFVSRTWNWLLSDRKQVKAQPDGERLVDQLVALAAAAQGAPVQAPFGVSLAPAWHAAARALLPDGPAYIGLAPGAGRRDTGKLWPLENFLAVGRAQVERGRTPVVLIGRSEEDMLPAIRAALPEALVPGYDALRPPAEYSGPALTVAIGGRLAAAVANCSGTGHMLAAGCCPLVSLFGPTRPEKFAPYTPRLITLRAQDYGQRAIDAIPTRDVIDAVERLTHSPRSPGDVTVGLRSGGWAPIAREVAISE